MPDPQRRKDAEPADHDASAWVSYSDVIVMAEASKSASFFFGAVL
jgi:hypothetical protein